MMTLDRQIYPMCASLGGMLAVVAIALCTGCKDVGGTAAAPDAQPSPGPANIAGSGARPEPEIDLDALWPPVRTNPPGILDFGEVPVNEPSQRMIELVNRGDVDVRLRTSRSNCGCTTTNVAGLVVPAGGTLELPIHFDAEGRVGERSATVDLFFVGWERPIKFRVVAMVVQS